MQDAVGGKYTGPLIAGRFQVIESMIGKTFFVADNQQEPDLVVREGGKIRRFDSQEEAENWIRNQGEAPVEPEVLPRARGNVGARTKELIQQGLDNDAVIAELKREFPNNANSVGNVRWHRNALKKEQGEPIRTRAPRTPRMVTPTAPTAATNGAATDETLDQIGRTLQALGATLIKMEKDNRQLKARNETLMKNMRAMLEG